MAIEKRTLGRTGVDVTLLGYGAMELRHDRVDDDLGGRLLNQVLDGGITFIDTAPDYGKSEDMIGRLISHRRDEYLLATKCGCVVPGDPDAQEPKHAWSAERLMKNLESSLKRLQTDHIDVWQLHSGMPEEIAESDVLEAMEFARQQGKVRFLGYSTKGRAVGDQGRAMLEQMVSWDVFDVLQVVYSGLARHVENLMAQADQRGRGLIVRGLTNVLPREWEAFESAGLDELRGEDESRRQFLLRLGFSHPALDTSIPGTSNPEHLAQNIAAAEAGPLPADVYAEAKRRLDAAGVVVTAEANAGR